MKRVIAAALILSVFAGTAALADDRDHRRDHGRHSYERDHHHRDQRHHDYDRRHHRHHDRHHHDRHHRGHSHDGHGVRHRDGHHHRSWHRGAYLPHHYRRPVYVVHDYHGHRLRPPPRGYHWVRVDRDIVLTAL